MVLRFRMLKLRSFPLEASWYVVLIIIKKLTRHGKLVVSILCCNSGGPGLDSQPDLPFYHYFSDFRVFVVLLTYTLVLSFIAKSTSKTQNFEKKKIHYFRIQKYIFLIWLTSTVDGQRHRPFLGRRQPSCSFLPGRRSTSVDVHLTARFITPEICPTNFTST